MIATLSQLPRIRRAFLFTIEIAMPVMHRPGPARSTDDATDALVTAQHGPLRYRAFISYSHSDAHWATWLHRRLENYRVPRRLRGSSGEFGPLPDRLIPIFRDREDLASAGELGSRIKTALADSEALIVICSPAAARSAWVNEEILAFKRLGRAGRTYSLIVAGEPHAADDRECFPPALRFELDADGALGLQPAEPIAADIRPGKDGKSLARMKLLSGLLGVNLDSLRQREAQRRQRRLLAITALALLVMLVTSFLAVQAVVARHAAERRQKQAENLVGFMLGDLNDKLAQVQRLDIMEAVDDQAMAYFESLPTTDVTDETLAQRAKALEKIGSVRSDQGHLPAAMESYRAALQLAAPLADARPADTARQLAYARIWAFIGTTYWYQGQLDEAQHSFESGQAILQRSQAHSATDLQLQYQLSTIDNNIGHVLEARGRLDEAAIQYGSMLALSRKLVAARPDNTEWSVQVALAHNNLGKLALLRGDLATAIAEYSADDTIESGLAARNPKDNDLREKVAITRATLGRTQSLAGNIETGIADLQQAVEIATQLTKVDPSNTGFQEDLALYASQLSRVLRLSGDLPAAAALTAQSMSIFLALTKQDPANTGWQRELADAQLEQAEQSRAAGQVGAARTQARAALAILAPIFARQPQDRATLTAVVAAKLLLAELTDDAQVVQQLRREALNAIPPAKSAGNDPRLLALQAEALLSLGRKADAQPIIQQLWDSGYRDLALLAVLNRERIDYPANAAFQQRLQAATRKTDRQ